MRSASAVAAAYEGHTSVARHITETHFGPWFLEVMATYDVASNICDGPTASSRFARSPRSCNPTIQGLADMARDVLQRPLNPGFST